MRIYEGNEPPLTPPTPQVVYEYILKEEDVGKHWIICWVDGVRVVIPCGEVLGGVQAIDVGKMMVYTSANGIWQVEGEEQRDRRLARRRQFISIIKSKLGR